MKTTEFKTFTVEVKDAQAWVTFDYPPVNIQDMAMLDDLNDLAEQLLRRSRSFQTYILNVDFYYIN